MRADVDATAVARLTPPQLERIAARCEEVGAALGYDPARPDGT